MEDLRITVSNLDVPMTVKEYLRKIGISVTLTKKVKCGGIHLNGRAVTVRAEIKNGDELKLIFPKSENESIVPMDIPLKVVYEDEHILVVDKPSNMPTHPSLGNSLPTLANAVIGKYGKQFTFRAINRLDRDTSGLVLIAKEPISANILSSAMKSGKFKKQYTCTVCGVPESKGIIDAPIRRESDGSVKRTVAPDGKHALTEYEVIEAAGDRAVCLVTLHTGRTHQIRVHMSYIGHPLVGDFLYGERESGNFDLRCSRLSFPHPTTGETMTFSI